MVVFENHSSNLDSCPALNCLLQFSKVLLWHLSHSKGKRGVELQVFLLFPSTELEESCCAQGSRKGGGARVPSCSHALRCSSASKARPDQLMETGSSCSHPSVFPPLNYHWFLSKACNSTTILGSYLWFCVFFNQYYKRFKQYGPLLFYSSDPGRTGSASPGEDTVVGLLSLQLHIQKWIDSQDSVIYLRKI